MPADLHSITVIHQLLSVKPRKLERESSSSSREGAGVPSTLGEECVHVVVVVEVVSNKTYGPKPQL